MYHKTGFRGIRLVMVAIWMVLGLVLFPAQSLLAQDTVNPPTADAQQVQEKDQAAPGEANPVDNGPAIEIGPERLLIPLLSGSGNGGADAAAVDTTIFDDEMCGFPAGWVVADDNPAAPVFAWTGQVLLGRCVARPNGYVNGMAIRMTRTINTIGGTIAGANMTFRFRMNTETGFDFLRYEFSCNSRKTWRGGTTIADSGAFGGASFIDRTISLVPCDESSSVQIRFWFTTDSSVIGTERPALDRVTVVD